MHHVLYLNERKTYYQKKTNESIKAKIKKIIIEKIPFKRFLFGPQIPLFFSSNEVRVVFCSWKSQQSIETETFWCCRSWDTTKMMCTRTRTCVCVACMCACISRSHISCGKVKRWHFQWDSHSLCKLCNVTTQYNCLTLLYWSSSLLAFDFSFTTIQKKVECKHSYSLKWLHTYFFSQFFFSNVNNHLCKLIHRNV